MGFFGNLLSEIGGGLASDLVGGGKAGGVAKDVVGSLGSLVPFKNGGRVKKTGPALVHKNEFILPAGIKPTKQQKKAVADRKKKAVADKKKKGKK
jgi:hypothetical protein